MSDEIDWGDMAKMIVDRVERGQTHEGIQFGTVTAVAANEGIVTYASVQVDGDSASITVPSLIGPNLATGQRVAVIWVNPHGCYIIGSPSNVVAPFARISMTCGGPL